MRILKYLFILLLLIGAALTVFLLTENSNFIRATKIYIPVQKEIVKRYVRDLSNWSSFYVFATEADSLHVTLNEPKTTLAWEQGSREGQVDFIEQSTKTGLWFSNTGSDADEEVSFQFKDSLQGVVVTLHEKVELNWKGRMIAYFQSIKSTQKRSESEQSLAQLKGQLLDEMELFHVKKSDGLYTIPAVSYVFQSVQLSQAEWKKNKRAKMEQFVAFVTQNQVQVHGQPFILYKTSPYAAQVEAEIGIALAQEMYVQPVSDVSVGERAAALAQRIEVMGDFQHLSEAYTQFKSISLVPNATAHATYTWMEEWHLLGQSPSKPSHYLSRLYRLYTATTPVDQPSDTVETPN